MLLVAQFHLSLFYSISLCHMLANPVFSLQFHRFLFLSSLFFVVVVSFNFSLIQSIQTSYVKSTRMKRNKQKTPSNFVSTPKENKMKMPKNDDNLRKISWKQTKKNTDDFFFIEYIKSQVRTYVHVLF